MAGSVGVLGSFNPLGTGQGFASRDTDSFLTILEKLREQVNALVTALNNLNADNASEHGAIVETLTAQFESELLDTKNYLENLIEENNDEVNAFDPTTGTRLNTVSRVISNVYDNARVFAMFAAQLDGKGWTAKQYDDMGLTARHFDLGMTYPVINDDFPVVN